MTTQTVTNFYRRDHDRLDELFRQFQALKRTNFADAVARFREFSDGLLRHIAWEEQILFPAFEQRTGLTGGGPTAVMRMEHRQIQSWLGLILTELQQGNAATDAAEAELRSVLGAHNRKEEHILYPAIDQHLSEPERDDVFVRMGVDSEP